MFPIAMSRGTIADRVLQADDIAGISDLYPAPSIVADTGGIVGRVTKNGSGVIGRARGRLQSRNRRPRSATSRSTTRGRFRHRAGCRPGPTSCASSRSTMRIRRASFRRRSTPIFASPTRRAWSSRRAAVVADRSRFECSRSESARRGRAEARRDVLRDRRRRVARRRSVRLGRRMRRAARTFTSAAGWRGRAATTSAMRRRELRGNAPGTTPPPFTLFTASTRVSRRHRRRTCGSASRSRASLAVEVGASLAQPHVGVRHRRRCGSGAQQLAGRRRCSTTCSTAACSGSCRSRLGRRLRPFASGGAGYLRQLHEDRTLVETGQVYYAGGGARYWLRGGARVAALVGLRGDVRA